MLDAAPTTALPVPDGGTDAAWRETSMLYFRAAVERLYWQDIAVMHSRVANCGDISPQCVFGLSAMAVFRRGAFSGVQSWRDYAAVRSRAAIRGSFFASCVPEGASDGKSAPSWQHIAAMHPKRAGFGKICAPCIRKAPQTAVWERTARRSCHEGAAFAARAPRIMHGAQVLPSFGARRVLGLLCVKGLGPGCVSALRIAVDGPACRHGISLRSAAAAYPAAERLALRHAAPAPPCSRRPAAIAPSCSRRPAPGAAHDSSRRFRPVAARPAFFRSAAAFRDPAHKKRPAFCWPFLRGYELSADYSARSFRRRSSSSASWWRLTLPDSVIGMASMNSMCSGRRRLATPMESRYSAMESSVGSTSPV